MQPATVVDVFCGIGGMTHGLVKEGFHVVAGIDVDQTCQYAYEANNPDARFIEADVENIAGTDILELYPRNHTRILVGCAPCQPFSKYAKRYDDQDEKWRLVGVFAHLISEIRPDIISMENVPELASHSIFSDFIEILNRSHYHVWYDTVNCADYGVPQTRKRLVVLASQFGPIELISKTHNQPRTVAQTIRSLPPINSGERSPRDPVHCASGLSELNLRRLRHTPAGGSWLDWPEELILACHKKETGKSYRNIYGRMKWDAPAPTITTEFNAIGSGRFGHPEQDRALSLREGALLQTFPKAYKLVRRGEEFYISTVARHIGNAVPVRLARVIARSIKKHLMSTLAD